MSGPLDIASYLERGIFIQQHAQGFAAEIGLDNSTAVNVCLENLDVINALMAGLAAVRDHEAEGSQ